MVYTLRTLAPALSHPIILKVKVFYTKAYVFGLNNEERKYI